ncbi:hypothetical protein COS91_02130 [Candidatus Desantisbacteria bacterium CG07_land_8_20_14_0_80_39_15]|uniref:DUF2934 domain-containing protein n=1 Tax=Candidatus Desantisbacteria bacterium CG07_land_8_20_14_0_80_39_15 TaxID=1974549 RepID=A0A2M6ZHI4_9BACT|nr:MAG: hypothetical protein COS91_02130 [Candidatus Desantisbacteria bacterium CG07_land_8_20_14_0_80_39_15]
MPRKKKSDTVEKVASTVKTAAGRITDKIMKEITLLAYKYFEQRGYQHGQELDDWLRAEKEIKKKYNIK